MCHALADCSQVETFCFPLRRVGTESRCCYCCCCCVSGLQRRACLSAEFISAQAAYCQKTAPFFTVTLSFADSLSARKEVCNGWNGGCQSCEAPAFFQGAFFYFLFLFRVTHKEPFRESDLRWPHSLRCACGNIYFIDGRILIHPAPFLSSIKFEHRQKRL